MQRPKGTFDILPCDTQELWRSSELWQYVEKMAHEIAMRYGYLEIRTPIYERTELFDRGVGETSDIVSKEMFTFEDKGGRSLSLRPEGTSSVMRSLIENRLLEKSSLHKLYYIGPMFRQERPQSGRYRQFHQFGVEAVGIAGPELDAEMIDLLYQFCRLLGIEELEIRLNTVGDIASRQAFRNALLAYLRPYFSELSEDSQSRFEKNPLRILDSKDPKDKELLQKAPSLLDFLSQDAREHFEAVRRLLDKIQIPYFVDDKVVRGLDYYNKTVFEILCNKGLGAQNTIGGGGRFDGLIKTFGGPDLPAVGFATGLERLLQTLISQKGPPPFSSPLFIYFIPLGEEAKARCFSLVTACRHEGISADIELQAKKLQAGLQRGVERGSIYCAIVGAEELESGSCQLKHLATREQQRVPFNSLISILISQRG